MGIRDAADPSPGSGTLPASLLHDLAARGVVRRYPAHAVLITEGDRSDALYVILSGRVKVYASNATGKEVVLNTHGPGEFVGELAFDGGARSASVTTLEPTACAVVTGEGLRAFVVDHPDVALHLIRHLIARVRALTGHVKSLALDDVHDRVAALLDRLAVDDGGRRVVRERLTQQEIADRVGSSREMVSRVFRRLVDDGAIVVERGRIRLLKAPTAGP